MKAFAAAAALLLALVACDFGVPAETAPTTAPTPNAVGQQQPAITPPAAQRPRQDPTQAIAAARAQAERVAGPDREDLLSLLRSAETVADETQRYQAYLGVWQFMRLIYMQQGQTADQRGVLDALEAIAKTFPQYQPDQFRLTPP